MYEKGIIKVCYVGETVTVQIVAHNSPGEKMGKMNGLSSNQTLLPQCSISTVLPQNPRKYPEVISHFVSRHRPGKRRRKNMDQYGIARGKLEIAHRLVSHLLAQGRDCFRVNW